MNRGITSDSLHERRRALSMRGDGSLGCDIFATTSCCRQCSDWACLSMYRYLLYLHHRSDGTFSYITTPFASGITCVVQCVVLSFDWRPTKPGKRLHRRVFTLVLTQPRSPTMWLRKRRPSVGTRPASPSPPMRRQGDAYNSLLGVLYRSFYS